MQKTTIRLEKGDVLNLTADALAVGSVYAYDGKHQDVLLNELDGAETIQFGPYLDACNLRVELEQGAVTTELQGASAPAPVRLDTKLTVKQGEAVADAADDTEVTDQLNALLASLRASGAIAT